MKSNPITRGRPNSSKRHNFLDRCRKHKKAIATGVIATAIVSLLGGGLHYKGIQRKADYFEHMKPEAKERIVEISKYDHTIKDVCVEYLLQPKEIETLQKLVGLRKTSKGLDWTVKKYRINWNSALIVSIISEHPIGLRESYLKKNPFRNIIYSFESVEFGLRQTLDKNAVGRMINKNTGEQAFNQKFQLVNEFLYTVQENRHNQLNNRDLEKLQYCIDHRGWLKKPPERPDTVGLDYKRWTQKMKKLLEEERRNNTSK